MSKQLSRFEREQQREADRNFEFYAEEVEAVTPPRAPVKCQCWFTDRELIYVVDGCMVHSEKREELITVEVGQK